jgi:hypothetical protein
MIISSYQQRDRLNDRILRIQDLRHFHSDIHGRMRVAWLCLQTRPSRFNHRSRANRGQDIQDDEGSGSAWIGAGKRVGGQKTVRTLGPLQVPGRPIEGQPG